MKLVIVGGVAGGASAATRARRLSETAEIVVFERGPDVSFANCGLPYYVGETIVDRSKLLVTTPEKLHERFRLDVRTRCSVEAIDRDRKVVRVHELATGRDYEEAYDKLILSPGAMPLRPPIPGVDLPGVMTLRNLQDVDRIKAIVDGGKRRAVVVGAGFIGLELVENFVHRKVATTLIEAQPQVLPLLDVEMVTPLAEALRVAGVRVLTGAGVTGIEARAEGALAVRLATGEAIETDLVVLGVGVRPENGLAVAAGLAIAPRGGILVNEFLETSDPDIYAVGDAVAIRDFQTGEPAQVPLAGPANRQGRLAADNALGRRQPYRGTQGTAILGLFGKIAATTGATEKQLRRAGTEYRKIYVHPAHHAGYYPGAEAMTLKLLFAPESGKILGAQGVGGAGVDKRIDVLAVAIQGGMTVFDLEEMELCYAPQFGSAKDPVNMAGFVAGGLLRGDHPQLAVEEVLALPDTDRPFLLDVRTPKEFSDGQIPGATNIPVDVLRERLSELPRERPIAVYCQVGQRGYIATRLLRQNGFDARNIAGGYKTYRLFHPAA
jgi:NADPH-dependent 2,4-dienoyl-CoA reductase/sulfur reductase-like enzyme/rhodanese-related sulfurtransferase